MDNRGTCLMCTPLQITQTNKHTSPYWQQALEFEKRMSRMPDNKIDQTTLNDVTSADFVLLFENLKTEHK